MRKRPSSDAAMMMAAQQTHQPELSKPQKDVGDARSRELTEANVAAVSEGNVSGTTARSHQNATTTTKAGLARDLERSSNADRSEDAASDVSETSSSSRRDMPTITTDKVTRYSVRVGEMEYSQFNQYIIVKDLGVGVHAKVALGLHIQENLLYAIKVSHRNAAVAETAVRKEIAILKKLNHKNVLKLYEVIDDQKTNELLLVLEYASSGPIFTRYDKRPLREPLIHRYIRDVLQGLDYLHHAAGIAHMDLKPENLLLMADGSVKIADFGVSFIGQSKAVNSNKKIVGTPAFIAPEMLGEDGYDPYIADIWSLGVCIFHMATAELPFIGRTIFQIVAMAQRQGLRFPPEAVVLSPELKNLLTVILVVDPTKRATLSRIMTHPWVTARGEQPLPPSLADQPLQIDVTEEEIAAAVRADPLATLLRPAFKTVHFRAGEIFIRKGVSGTVMYFINSGECEVLVDALEHTEQYSEASGGELFSHDVSKLATLAVRSAGAVIGEMAVLEAIQNSLNGEKAIGSRTATVRALTDLEVLSVTVDDLLAALSKDKGGKDQLVRTASYRILQNEEIMLQLAETQKDMSLLGISEEVKTEGFIPARKLNVLFAEDSVPTQFIVKRLIKRFGIIELVCVNDGKSALEHCEKCMKGNETIPDIILMDLQMPVMDGLESSRRIRKLGGEMSTVPIVAVSSGIKSMSQKDCVKAGMSDYVAKPLNQQLLTKILLDNLPQPLISSAP